MATRLVLTLTINPIDGQWLSVEKKIFTSGATESIRPFSVILVIETIDEEILLGLMD